ncbi:hypothetical protein DCC81_12105 [Chitinophaga parva]|uniref:Serine/threonine protein kinase n=1 Tax=Chitinophaga parva TaxID=2169414 RepID=A0A2T7BFI7_9BACT|nr:recombinase RecT [Chitinophaga parva]PUZ25050.1 hypothetical protein DCC81_12105 [Chitinophaga parva]
MENSKQQLLQLINNARPAELIEAPVVADRFKDLYKVIHGIQNDTAVAAYYEAEKFHFLKMINDNPNLATCSKLSIYGVFMDVAVSGLSFDPSAKHLYVVPYNINVGTKDNPKWEKRAALQVSGYGELLLRTIQGQIKHADNPVLVYEGDKFMYGTSRGATLLEHTVALPRTSNNILACYLRITRADDTVDYKVMSMEELQVLRGFSKDSNSVAWTKGIAGMMVAKTIKHAFKTYPKIRLGEFSRLESETVDTEADIINGPDYGLPAGDPVGSFLEDNSKPPVDIAPTPSDELDF